MTKYEALEKNAVSEPEMPQLGNHKYSADSDDLARVYRFDLAQDSEMISPTIPILMPPGA